MTRRRPLVAVPEQGTLRAVAYVRVSAVMGREELHSPDLQLRAIRDLFVRRGLLEVDVIQDIDASGRNFQREGIQRVLALARDRKVDVVALYDLSRLGRNTGESLRVVAELRSLGVSVVSTVEQIDDGPEGQFMLGQFLGMAQLYSDQIGRRWAETARYRAERGLYVGGHPPLGYHLISGQGLVVDPVLGPAVQTVFEQYAAGHGISAIARQFNRSGERARHVAVMVVKRMLGNPVYIGKVRLNGRLYDGVHERLVDDRTWRKVAARLEQDARTPPRRLAVAYALTGLVFCRGCGYHVHHMAPGPAEASRGGVARLVCARAKDFHDCPGIGSPSVPAVEAEVLEQLRALMAAAPLGRAQDSARRARGSAAAKSTEQELTQTRAARGRLAVDLARRLVDENAFRLADAELADAERRLVVDLGEARAAAAAPTRRAAEAAHRALADRWDVMTGAERNRALRVILESRGLRVELSYPAHRGAPYPDRVRLAPKPGC